MEQKRHQTDCLEIGEFVAERLNKYLTPYPVIAEKSTDKPFAIYRRIGYTGRDTKDKYNYEETILIEITIVTEKYKQGIELASAIKNEFEYLKGTWRNTVITSIVLTNSSEDYIGEAYTQNMTFQINIDNEKYKRLYGLQ